VTLRFATFNAIATAAGLVVCTLGCSSVKHSQGSQRASFQGFQSFDNFTRTETAGAVALVSPQIDVPHRWDELVVSWNASCPPSTRLVVEARAFDGFKWTRFYSLGIWAEDLSRESVRGQKDSDATVQTDTLCAKRSMRAAQVRLTLIGDGTTPSLKFLGASFLDSSAPLPSATRTNRAAWGKTIEVPRRSQLGYPGASGWCSPTCISMLLAYWGGEMHRPEMDLSVPEVAVAVHDRNWPGTGNWPFNTAFAGKFPGMRAYVTRFDELAQVEDLLASGVPVALSVSSDLLNGKAKDEGNGHLIVVVGFTESGDVVVNDPWPNPKQENSLRKVFPRERVLKAWQRSKQTVYVVKGS
jgi:uncharacterized protein YvpB